jgi:hypothetical protein
MRRSNNLEGETTVYEIRVKGHLGGHWSEWFGGLEITNLENGEAVLSGAIVDQAALHGVLTMVRDLGLPLVAVKSLDPGGEEDSVRSTTTQ